MKKFVLVLIIMLSVLCSSAENIDIDSMNLSDLIILHDRIEGLISDTIECRMNEDSIYQGVFYVGEDIKPGYYLFTCIDDCRDKGNFDFFYEIYNTKEDYERNSRSFFDRFNVGESARIELKDGMVLRIVNGTANVKMVSKPSWAN